MTYLRSYRARIALVVSMAVLGPLAAQQQAAADDRYAAAFCEPYAGGVTYTSASLARNNSATSTSSLICPGRHSLTGLVERCFTARVIDTNASANATCDVAVRGTTSTLYSLPDTTSGSSTSSQLLEMTAWVNGAFDTLAIRCVLPAGTTNAVEAYTIDATCPPS